MLTHPVNRKMQTLLQIYFRRPAQQFLRKNVISQQAFDLAVVGAQSRLVGLDFHFASNELDDQPRQIPNADFAAGAKIDRFANGFRDDAARINPSTVLETKFKSRVGRRFPKCTV